MTRILLLGIIIALTILLWQSMVFAAPAPTNPNTFAGLRVDGNLDVVGCVRYYNGTDLRSFVCGGTTAIGDEIIQGRPWQLEEGRYRTRMSGVKLMFAQYNDLCWDCTEQEAPYRPGFVIADGEGRHTPYIYGVVGQTGENQDNWVWRIEHNSYCWASETAGKSPAVFDTCVRRIDTPTGPDLQFTAGGRYFYLSEVSTLLGR